MVKGKLPTFEVASVRELRVVDFPEEGLPTRAIRGSRGMIFCGWGGGGEIGGCEGGFKSISSRFQVW